MIEGFPFRDSHGIQVPHFLHLTTVEGSMPWLVSRRFIMLTVEHVAEHSFNGSEPLPKIYLLPQHDTINVVEADQEIHLPTLEVVGHLQSGGHTGGSGIWEGHAQPFCAPHLELYRTVIPSAFQFNFHSVVRASLLGLFLEPEASEGTRARDRKIQILCQRAPNVRRVRASIEQDTNFPAGLGTPGFNERCLEEAAVSTH